MSKIKIGGSDFRRPEFAIDELELRNALDPPFVIYGLILPETQKDCYRRMPQKTADRVSDRVSRLSRNTAGGRLRFRTNSSSIAVFAKMAGIERMPHFSLTGMASFDLYVDGFYRGTFMPPETLKDGYSAVIRLGDCDYKNITVNFPLYSDVNALAVGVDKGAEILPPKEYGISKPIVFYGSSITQGGCASRSGNSYEAVISRRLDCDYLNLGFSGGAKGETAMARYIKDISMSAFVYDYDHNAPTPEYLAETHKKMFDIIRKSNPLLPIVIVSRPDIQKSADTDARYEIIKKTYEDALSEGDKNVYLIDGRKIMAGSAGDAGTVDTIHPNDFGFSAMAKCIGDVLEDILKGSPR